MRLCAWQSMAPLLIVKSADDFNPQDEGLNAKEHAAPQYDAQQVR